MTAVSGTATVPPVRLGALSLPPATRIVAAGLGFVPVVALALRGGGYDIAIRSQIALGAWWIVALIVLVGARLVDGPGRRGWCVVALLGGFAVWTGLATTWSLSPGDSVATLGLVAGYLGIFVLGLLAMRSDAIASLVAGQACAFALLASLAVLSRLTPAAFPPDHVVQFFPGARSRLDYPLGYADGTGEFLAIGLAPLMWATTAARSVTLRVIAGVGLSVTVLAMIMTASRGGLITGCVAALVYLLLVPDRLSRLAALAPPALGAAALVVGFLTRAALRDGLDGPVAIGQRHQLLIVAGVTVVTVALTEVAVARAAHRLSWRPRLALSRRAVVLATVSAALAVGVVLVAAAASGRLSTAWTQFTQVSAPAGDRANVDARLITVAGSHRYQYWQAAFEAFRTRPLLGIGPGTFQYWWAAHGTVREYVLNAHSLYLETLAETGLIGLLLLGGFLVSVLLAAVVAHRRASPARRPAVAAAIAGYAAFLVTAGYDWVWQIAVVPVVALTLAAGLIRAGGDAPAVEPTRRLRRHGARTTVLGLSLVAMVAVALPYGEAVALRLSASRAARHDYRAALAAADTAQQLEPFAAGPSLQRALVFEAAGDLGAAQRAVVGSVRRAPRLWQSWVIEARIDAERGETVAALRAYRRAARLDPLFLRVRA